MQSPLFMRPNNAGVTAKVNLWALAKYVDKFDSEKARLWVRGEVTNAETKERKKFNDAGELITILGKWNAVKFRQLRLRPKRKSGRYGNLARRVPGRGAPEPALSAVGFRVAGEAS